MIENIGESTCVKNTGRDIMELLHRNYKGILVQDRWSHFVKAGMTLRVLKER